MILTLPIYWVNEKKTKKSTTHLVGMNFYRNAHYHIKNKMKKDFSELVKNQVGSDKKFNTFKVNYKLYYKNSSSDGSNVIALVEKFMLDALQELGHLENDNVNYHLGSQWIVAGKDAKNPRCEIEIEEIK